MSLAGGEASPNKALELTSDALAEMEAPLAAQRRRQAGGGLDGAISQ